MEENKDNVVDREMDDDTFKEPKNTHTGTIILILLLVILLGGGIYYYFVLDNPKMIFKVFTKEITKMIPYEEYNGYDEFNITYDIDATINDAMGKDNKIYNIINKVGFKGRIGYDKDKKMSSLVMNNTYDDELLPVIKMLVTDDDMYVNIEEVYDKTIKIEKVLDKDGSSNNSSVTIDDYKYLFQKDIDTFKSGLDNANYRKEYVKLDDKYVKKITLVIDEEFRDKYNKTLLQDNEYTSIYKNVYGEEFTQEDIFGDADIELSIYLGILNNEFLMFEENDMSDSNEQLKITKAIDKYNYEYSQDYTLMYSGSVQIKNNDKDMTALIVVNSLEDNYKLELKLNYNIDTSIGIDEVDTDTAVSYKDIVMDEDSLLEKLLKNKAIRKIITGVDLDNILDMDIKM